jgi:hypothetical protein
MDKNLVIIKVGDSLVPFGQLFNWYLFQNINSYQFFTISFSSNMNTNLEGGKDG